MSLQRLPFRDFTAEEFLGRTLTIGAGGGFFREAVSLSARWLMRASMLAGAPTSIRKRSQLERDLRIKRILRIKKQGGNGWLELRFHRRYSLNIFHWEISEFI